jgi:hypothetical protein
MKALLDAVNNAVRRGQVAGRLDPAADSAAIAQYFVTVAQGLNVINKAGGDPATLRKIVDVAMGVWRGNEVDS